MLKTALLTTVIAAAFTVPALAADTAPSASGANDASMNETFVPVFNEKQARLHLARQGYKSISPLTRDQEGTWRGTANKNGKNVLVAVTTANLAAAQ